MRDGPARRGVARRSRAAASRARTSTSPISSSSTSTSRRAPTRSQITAAAPHRTSTSRGTATWQHRRTSAGDFSDSRLGFGAMLGAALPDPVGSVRRRLDAAPRRRRIRSPTGCQPEKGPLRIVNYADYVNPDVSPTSRSEYGVKVEITTIDSDTEMIQKLASGAIKVDLNHSMAEHQHRPADRRGLDPAAQQELPHQLRQRRAAFNDPWYDTGACTRRRTPFFGTGIGYRADRIDPAQIDEWGWDTLWNAAEFKGQCSILDDEREAFAMAMLRQGHHRHQHHRPEDHRPGTRRRHRADRSGQHQGQHQGYKDVPEGITTIAHTWSADMIAGAASYLPEGTGPEVLGFWHPPAGRRTSSPTTAWA